MVMNRVPAELVVRGSSVIAFACPTTVKEIEASGLNARILEMSAELALLPVLYARMEMDAGPLMRSFVTKVLKLSMSACLAFCKPLAVILACRDCIHETKSGMG